MKNFAFISFAKFVIVNVISYLERLHLFYIKSSKLLYFYDFLLSKLNFVLLRLSSISNWFSLVCLEIIVVRRRPGAERSETMETRATKRDQPGFAPSKRQLDTTVQQKEIQKLSKSSPDEAQRRQNGAKMAPGPWRRQDGKQKAKRQRNKERG